MLELGAITVAITGISCVKLLLALTAYSYSWYLLCRAITRIYKNAFDQMLTGNWFDFLK